MWTYDDFPPLQPAANTIEENNTAESEDEKRRIMTRKILIVLNYGNGGFPYCFPFGTEDDRISWEWDRWGQCPYLDTDPHGKYLEVDKVLDSVFSVMIKTLSVLKDICNTLQSEYYTTCRQEIRKLISYIEKFPAWSHDSILNIIGMMEFPMGVSEIICEYSIGACADDFKSLTMLVHHEDGHPKIEHLHMTLHLLMIIWEYSLDVYHVIHDIEYQAEFPWDNKIAMHTINTCSS